jgi:hypothetical protein
VQRLDRDDYDYIVQFQQRQGVTARLLINGFNGELGEASGIEIEGAMLKPYVEPRLEPYIGKTFDLPAVASRVIRAGTVGTHPVLGWKPCKESTSPFLPFYLLTVGDAIIYWRVDDARFDHLTEGFA